MTGMRIIVKVSPELIPGGEVCRVLGYRMSGTLAESIPDAEVCRVFRYRMSGALEESIPESEVCRVNGYRIGRRRGLGLRWGLPRQMR